MQEWQKLCDIQGASLAAQLQPEQSEHGWGDKNPCNHCPAQGTAGSSQSSIIRADHEHGYGDSMAFHRELSQDRDQVGLSP